MSLPGSGPRWWTCGRLARRLRLSQDLVRQLGILDYIPTRMALAPILSRGEPVVYDGDALLVRIGEPPGGPYAPVDPEPFYDFWAPSPKKGEALRARYMQDLAAKDALRLLTPPPKPPHEYTYEKVQFMVGPTLRKFGADVMGIAE